MNTSDLLQRRRPGSFLWPQWCILCKSSGESADHVSCHALLAGNCGVFYSMMLMFAGWYQKTASLYSNKFKILGGGKKLKCSGAVW